MEGLLHEKLQIVLDLAHYDDASRIRLRRFELVARRAIISA